MPAGFNNLSVQRSAAARRPLASHPISSFAASRFAPPGLSSCKLSTPLVRPVRQRSSDLAGITAVGGATRHGSEFPTSVLGAFRSLSSRALAGAHRAIGPNLENKFHLNSPGRPKKALVLVASSRAPETRGSPRKTLRVGRGRAFRIYGSRIAPLRSQGKGRLSRHLFPGVGNHPACHQTLRYEQHHQGAGFITATIGALVVLFIWNRLVASRVISDPGNR